MKKLIPTLAGLWLNILAVISPRRAAQYGIDLFCHPMRQPLTAKHMTFLDSAEKSTFEHQHINIQTYKWGEGEHKVLFLHGWQSHSYRWKKYIESFDKKQYTLYALDAPGHGLSGGKYLSVPSYAEVIRAFTMKYSAVDVVVCHSMGCFAALYAFYQHPAITPKVLIALASPGEAEEFFTHYTKLLSLSARTTRLLRAKFTEVFKKTPAEFSAPLFSASLKIPGLLIHDEEDDDTSVEHSKRIHAAWKSSTLMVTKGLGHNLRSAGIVKKVVAFVQETIQQRVMGYES